MKDIAALSTVTGSVLAGTLVLLLAAIAQSDLNVMAVARIQPVQWLSLI